MACRGVHFAIAEVDAKRLLSAPSDDAILEIIQDDIEERWEEEWLYQSDKTWDAIHRCLSDGTLGPDGGTYPLKLAVLNGRRLYSRDDYIVSPVTLDEVRDLRLAWPRSIEGGSRVDMTRSIQRPMGSRNRRTIGHTHGKTLPGSRRSFKKLQQRPAMYYLRSISDFKERMTGLRAHPDG